MSNDEEPFLKRWSRRKLDAKGRPQGAAEDAAAEDEAPAAPVEDGERPRKQPPGREPQRVLTEEDFADVDFDALDMQSDYSRFLAPGVPESIKNKALRKLWSSDAMFTSMDPFQDYTADYTDAALAVPAGTLKTAYRIGKGFLSDEEAAEWDALGKPETEKAAVAKRGAASEAAVQVALETADQPDVHALIRQLDADRSALYPGASSQLADVAELTSPNVRVAVARRGGTSVGCGAVILGDDGEAEIKRMFVVAEARRQSIGRTILAALEDAAREAGARVIRLEMGRRQTEAIALYRSQGYVERGPFGAYEKGPHSVFMEKWIA